MGKKRFIKKALTDLQKVQIEKVSRYKKEILDKAKKNPSMTITQICEDMELVYNNTITNYMNHDSEFRQICIDRTYAKYPYTNPTPIATEAQEVFMEALKDPEATIGSAARKAGIPPRGGMKDDNTRYNHILSKWCANIPSFAKEFKAVIEAKLMHNKYSKYPVPISPVDNIALTKRKKLFLETFNKHHFIIANACKELEINRKELNAWIEWDEDFKEEFELLKKDKQDYVEDKLIQLMEDGSERATLFIAEHIIDEYKPQLQTQTHKHELIQSKDQIDAIVKASSIGAANHLMDTPGGKLLAEHVKGNVIDVTPEKEEN